jgi:hypothetical protein
MPWPAQAALLQALTAAFCCVSGGSMIHTILGRLKLLRASSALPGTYPKIVFIICRCGKKRGMELMVYFRT